MGPVTPCRATALSVRAAGAVVSKDDVAGVAMIFNGLYANVFPSQSQLRGKLRREAFWPKTPPTVPVQFMRDT